MSKTLHIIAIVLVTAFIIMLGWHMIESRGSQPHNHWDWLIGKFTRGQSAPVTWNSDEHFTAMQKQIDEMFAKVIKDFPAGITPPTGAVRDADRGDFSMFQQMRRMQDEIDRMFARSWDDMGHYGTRRRFDDGWNTITATPSMEIRDTTNTWEISLYLPGIQKSDIRVALDGPVLIISARHRANTETNSNEQSTVSHATHQIERRIRLPTLPDSTAGIHAIYTNDTLRVVIAKPANAVTLEKEIPLG